MKKLFLLQVFCVVVSYSAAQTYDLIVQNGKIIDGTGNSWYYGDVAISKGKIVAVGIVKGNAVKTIDAKGMMVAPGFIDVHTHIEGGEFATPTADNFIFDGVTSVVTGNCGNSNLDLARYFSRLDSLKLSINVASLTGHNTIRRAVLGDENRTPTNQEQKKMEEHMKQAMLAGAVGLSTGLIYVPGTYAKTEEIVGLARIAAEYGGVYASHIRDEADQVTEAVEEAINIGKQANIPVEISHFKTTYKPNWGKSAGTLQQVENARLQGYDITIDQYPYTASSTTLDITLPSWAFAGGRDSLKARLKDPVLRKRIKIEMIQELKDKKLKNYSYAVVARYSPDSTLNGKNISEINIIKGRKASANDEVETILEMIAAVNRTQMIYFSMDELDLVRILQYPFNMIASDATINRFGAGVPHPRAYGTNARVLGKYVYQQKVIRLEEAIRRMTSLPAQKFKLKDRGLLREGMAADIVVFDEKKVMDQATYSKPHAYSNGFQYVIVNGMVVIENQKHLGVRSGMVLKGQAANN